MKKTDFTFKFNGSSEIDINVLINSLKDVSISLQEISKAENGSELEIKVKPFKEGSFEVLLALMDANVLQYVPLVDSFIPGETIVDKFKNIFELVKFFKGEKITEGKVTGNDNVVFTTDSGDILNIDNSIKIDESVTNAPIFNAPVTNYYAEPVYRNAVIHIENLILNSSEFESITGIELLKNEKVISKIEKKELVEVARRIADKRTNQPKLEKPKDTRDVLKNRVTISICKIDMDGDSNWDVIYDGKKVKLSNEDEDFKKDLNEGKYGFHNRDKIQVNLKIVQHYDKKSDDYINKEYIITKFLREVKVEKQAGLFDED